MCLNFLRVARAGEMSMYNRHFFKPKNRLPNPKVPLLRELTAKVIKTVNSEVAKVHHNYYFQTCCVRKFMQSRFSQNTVVAFSTKSYQIMLKFCLKN